MRTKSQIGTFFFLLRTFTSNVSHICKARNYLSDFYKIIFSVSKTTRELLLKWGNDPVQLSTEVKMPQFLVEEVIAESCDETSVMGESLQS